MLKSVAFLALLIVSTAGKKCNKSCEEENGSSNPVSSNDVLKNLRINQLGLPGSFNEEFVENTQSFVGQFVLNLAKMREQRIDQSYIKEMEGYQTGFVNKINKFGSLSDQSSFTDRITDYSKYLGTQTERISQYTERIRDTNVQYYFYNALLNMISTRSFLTSSLNNIQCIYQTPVYPGSGFVQPGRQPPKQGGSSESDDRSDI